MAQIDLQTTALTADVLRKLTLSDAGVCYLLDLLTRGESNEFSPEIEEDTDLVVETFSDGSVLTWRDGQAESVTTHE